MSSLFAAPSAPPGDPVDASVEEVCCEWMPAAPEDAGDVATVCARPCFPPEPESRRRRDAAPPAPPRPETEAGPPDVDVERLKELEDRLGHTFLDRSLLRNALTHSSSTANKRYDNERLEFLGDAVLDLIVRERLFQDYPDSQEGELTEVKSALVSGAALTREGQRLELDRYLILGRGVGRRRGGVPRSLLANAFEAVIAALYLDGGFNAARAFIYRWFADGFANAFVSASQMNFKSLLQRQAQLRCRATPEYRVVDQQGPEHARRFTVAVSVAGVDLGQGEGRNKKEAEQEAARRALAACEDLDGEDV